MTPCKFVDSADWFYSIGEWKILFTTRQVEFRFVRFVRFDEWKILCSIWHIVFSIRKLHLISDNDPLQACRFGRFVLFGEWKILFTTRQVEFRFVRFVRFDEWKILCSIWHIVFSIRKLHLINDNDPLQACRFGRFVLFVEWKILLTTRQVEFRFVRFDWWKILCSIWHCVLHPKIASH